MSVVMTSTEEKRSLDWVDFASAAEFFPENHLKGTNFRITYELWNVNSIRWWCWNIATDEVEGDYWQSEAIAFVVEFWF
jgi:hypothetical protein